MDNFLEYTYNRILEIYDNIDIDQANWLNSEGNEYKTISDYHLTDEYEQSISEIELLKGTIRSYNINKKGIFYE